MTEIESAKVKKAYLFALVANTSLALSHLIVKILSQYLPIPYWQGGRGILLFLWTAIFLFKDGKSLHVENKKAHKYVIIRSILSGLTQIFLTLPLNILPIGITVTLYNLGPIMAYFIQYFFFHKGQIKKNHLLLTLVCFAGVVLIIQPEPLFSGSSNLNISFYYYLLPILGALFGVVSMFYIHQLAKICDKDVTVSYGYLLQGSMNYILFSFSFSSESLLQKEYPPWYFFFFSVIFFLIVANISQTSRVASAYLASPSKILPFGYSGVVLSVFFDMVLFEIKFNALMLVGIFLTSLGLLSKFIIGEK